MGCSKEEPIPMINKQWIEDIKFIKQELPVRHINLFSNISQEDFDSEIESLIKSIPQLEENEIICGLMKIFAKIGDSHTGIHNVYNLSKFNIAPVKYEVFDDGVYIVEIIESAKNYLKQKVVAINEQSIDEVNAKISDILPHENDHFVRSSIPNFLRLYEILEALELIDSKNSYQLTLGSGEKIQVRGSTSTSTILSSCYLPDKTPLYRQDNDINYWYKIIDHNIVYLQYNKCAEMSGISFEEFIRQMFEELKDFVIDKFVIDLRLNAGGSSLLMAPLIEELKKHGELGGKIYGCIGCKTFSSGLINAIQIKKELGAILLGEPTGGKPNHFGDIQELILPNTELMMRYSTKYFIEYPDNDISTLEPDYYVENNSFDCFNGIDSYIEFIKSN